MVKARYMNDTQTTIVEICILFNVLFYGDLYLTVRTVSEIMHTILMSEDTCLHASVFAYTQMAM